MVSRVYFSHPTNLRRTGVCRVSERRVYFCVWYRVCISHTLQTCATQECVGCQTVVCILTACVYSTVWYRVRISHTLHICAAQKCVGCQTAVCILTARVYSAAWYRVRISHTLHICAAQECVGCQKGVCILLYSITCIFLTPYTPAPHGSV